MIKGSDSRSNYFLIVIMALFVLVQISLQIDFVATSLNSGDDLSFLTGRATNSQGNLSITVQNVLSIVLDDDSIDFVACTPGETIYSDYSDGNPSGSCPGFVPDELLIRNDGNLPANVTISFSDWGEAHGGTFLNSTTNTSWVAYKTTNASSHPSFSGGCTGSLVSSWQNVTNTSHSDLLGCDYLQSSVPYNSFEFDISIFIPETTQSGNSTLLITFTAQNP